MELETYVMLAERLNYTGHEDAAGVLDRIAEVSRMLTSLRLRLLEPQT